MFAKLTRFTGCLLFAASIAVPSVGFAEVIEENPSALAMTGDAIFARPVLFGMTVIGTAVFVASLPFSLLGGNVGEAAETLVVGPAKTTFVRCLGCTRTGRKDNVVVAAAH